MISTSSIEPRSPGRNTRYWVPVFSIACALSTASCEPAERSLTWDSLFEVREPRTIPASVTDSILSWGADEGVAQFVPQTPAGFRISASALRGGKLRPTTDMSDAAVIASYFRNLGKAFPTPPALGEAPYWGQGIPHDQFAVPLRDRVFVASSLLYPIRIFRSDVVTGTIEDPPPSWQHPRVPELGEFSNVGEGAPDRIRARNRYVESLTIIVGMAAVADSVLLVNHGRMVTGAGGEEVIPKTVDVYLKDVRVATDVPSPGRILAVTPRSIFSLQRGANLDTVTEHVWRGRR